MRDIKRKCGLPTGRSEKEFADLMEVCFDNKVQVANWAKSGSIGRLVYELDPALGSGNMVIQRLAPMCLAAIIDFSCERCPNMPSNPLDTGRGRWFTVNYCSEGRCEVSVDKQGFAVVKAGDCCVSCADSWPEEFNYPLGVYRGVELWINTELDHDPSLSLLKQAAVSLGAIARDAGLASVFSNDDALNDPLRRIESLLDGSFRSNERVISGCKMELMRFFYALSERNVAAAKPVSLLSPGQTQVVKRMGERMRANILDVYDARVMASEVGVSAATLNNWFKSLYGLTVSGYLRHLRIMEAEKMLATGSSVTEASTAVGYANPSKFAAAFRRERGLSPSDYRHERLSSECQRAYMRQ